MHAGMELMDRLIPLTEGDHSDCIGFRIAIPMRYAECFAIHRNGREVRLKNRGQFLGWRDNGRSRALLFFCDGLGVEIRLTDAQSGKVRGIQLLPDLHIHRCGTHLPETRPDSHPEARKFIARDGTLLFIDSPSRTKFQPASDQQQAQAVSPLAVANYEHAVAAV